MEEEEEEKFMKSAKKNAGCTINARSTRDYEPMRVPTTRLMEERGGGGGSLMSISDKIIKAKRQQKMKKALQNQKSSVGSWID